MIFAQLKQQPAKLQWRRNELLQQEKEIKEQLKTLDENYRNTMNYIKSEETTQRLNQDHIQRLDIKIKNNLDQLKKMKAAKKAQN